MITDPALQREYYEALLNKNPAYDGIFFAGIRTTGIFCHATCTAKKPKFENCTFFHTAEEALLSGYRPCKRCHPLFYPQQIPAEVRNLVEAVEADPARRWKEADFQALGVHSATARRKFKEVYGMTFVQYARARRMGIAFKEITQGETVINQQLATGYESSSAFHDAFSKIMGNPPKKANSIILYMNMIATPIGRMIAISTEEALYLLEFIDRRGLEKEIERLRMRYDARILVGNTSIHKQTTTELEQYFNEQRTQFSVPLMYSGTPFQQEVWHALEQIPYGETTSYTGIAHNINRPTSVRAIGNANGANQIAIIIPCHRVIQQNGDLGGYGGGIERKKYLLALEAEKNGVSD